VKRRAWIAWIAVAGCVSAPNDAPERASRSAQAESRAPASAPAESAVWESRDASGPSARASLAMAYDSDRGKVVLFGGASDGTELGDTWEWDGAAWTSVCTGPCATGAPPARSGHAMAYDPVHRRAVIFGGEGAGALLDDTWTWDGAAWARVCAPGACGPPARVGHAMAYDVARDRVVLFGGSACSSGVCSDFGDTWEQNGGTWSRASAVGPARSGHAMTFDAARGVTVVFGGAHGGVLGDTWTWDGATWKQASTTSAPPPRASAGMAFDRARRLATLFGGDGASPATWSWDGAAWTLLPTASDPGARSSFGLAYDDARQRVTLFGGFGNGAALADTWEERRLGGGCATGAECDTGLCLDGACCASPCAACASCSAGAAGVCEPVANADDPDSCTGVRTCDARSLCLLKVGQPCQVRADCASGYCVDGVCCATACDDRCSACTAALTGGVVDGTCGPALGGLDPHDDCPDDGACSCQRNGACDGAGACALYGRGFDCAACDGRDPGFASACNGAGACVPASTVRCVDAHVLAFADGGQHDCVPFRCTTEATCLATCTSAEDCSGSNVCGADGVCAAPRFSTEVPAAACAHAPAGGDPPSWIAALPLAALVARRARRRVTSCPSA
jgi:hypothetical protein